MIERGEHEAEACLLDASSEFFCPKVDPDSQSFKNIGTAALGGDAAISVFHDDGSGGGGDEHGGGGDVEKVKLVATGAADIEGGAREVEQTEVRVHGVFEKGFDEAGDLVWGLTFEGKGFEQAGFFFIRCGGVEQEIGEDLHLARSEILLGF